MNNVFSLFLILSLAFSIGCESQNPICGDTLCVDGSVFLKSELPAGTEYDSVNVDESVILATLVGTPVPVKTAPIEPTAPSVATMPIAGDDFVTLADIVADVSHNKVNSIYKEQTVTITGAVKFILEATQTRNSTVTLHTHDEQVSFFVTDPDGADDLAHLVNGTTYTFTLFIRKISASTSDLEKTNIFTDIQERPRKSDINIETVTMAEIVFDVVEDGKRYLGKTISIRATVSFARLKTSGLIALSTGNNAVRFNVLDVQNPENLNPYHGNVAYNFTLYIYDISEEEDNPGEYKIFAEIADD